MILAVLALAAALSAEPASDEKACGAATTLQVNACLADRQARAEAERLRYVAAARARLARDAEQVSAGEARGLAQARQGFDKAEAAWLAYREAACQAVYDFHSGGTIRAAKELECRLQLTLRHTHTVWSQWLTYPDSTPPILPEPPVPAGR